MMYFVVHSGQTGVERGGHRAATANGLPVAGFTSADRRDELGPLPADVSAALLPCHERGSRPALRANLRIASGALIVVPNAARADSTPAMLWLLQHIRGMKLPHLIADPMTSLADAVAWAASLPPTCGSRRIMVTGPRATRWHDGEDVARRLIHAIGVSHLAERAEAEHRAVFPGGRQ